MNRIIAGRRAVIEAMRAKTVTTLFVDASMSRKLAEFVDEARTHDIAVKTVDRDQLDRLAKREGVKHQGVLAEGPPYAYRGLEEIAHHAEIVVALDELSDPHNFGAIVRTAIAFGVRDIVLPERRSVQVTASVVRASVGATEHARIARVTNLQKALVDLTHRGFRILGLDASGSEDLTMLHGAGETDKRVIVVGSEGKGLRRLVRERCDTLCRIPQVGPVASLNASVAASIALYEATRSRA